MEGPSKTNEITIAEKYKVLLFLWAGHSERETVQHFSIGKGTVNRIKKNQDKIIALYEDSNISSYRCRKLRKTEFEEINLLTWECF